MIFGGTDLSGNSMEKFNPSNLWNTEPKFTWKEFRVARENYENICISDSSLPLKNDPL